MDSGQACQKGILPDVLPKVRFGWIVAGRERPEPADSVEKVGFEFHARKVRARD